jgi:hypothetical protein
MVSLNKTTKIGFPLDFDAMITHWGDYFIMDCEKLVSTAALYESVKHLFRNPFTLIFTTYDVEIKCDTKTDNGFILRWVLQEYLIEKENILR